MDEIRAGTLHLSDAEFVATFESYNLPATEFHHADHVRLAWIYLREFGEAEAAERILVGIQRFSSHNGSPGKFHVTRTLAWMALVAESRRATPEISGFSEFAAAHPHLFDAQRLLNFYSLSHLESEAARMGWVEADRRPLPRCMNQNK
jgi:hypothetical protein